MLDRKSRPISLPHPKPSLIGDWMRCGSFTTSWKSWNNICTAVADHLMICAVCGACCLTKGLSGLPSPRTARKLPDLRPHLLRKLLFEFCQLRRDHEHAVGLP